MNVGSEGATHTRTEHNVSVCHAKGSSWPESVMAWVSVIPKEGRTGPRAPFLLLVWHRLLRISLSFSFFFGGKKIWFFLFFFENSVSYQKKDGRGHARSSFFLYDDSGHKGPFCVTQPNVSDCQAISVFPHLIQQINWFQNATNLEIISIPYLNLTPNKDL